MEKEIFKMIKFNLKNCLFYFILVWRNVCTNVKELTKDYVRQEDTYSFHHIVNLLGVMITQTIITWTRDSEMWRSTYTTTCFQIPLLS